MVLLGTLCHVANVRAFFLIFFLLFRTRLLGPLVVSQDAASGAGGELVHMLGVALRYIVALFAITIIEVAIYMWTGVARFTYSLTSMVVCALSAPRAGDGGALAKCNMHWRGIPILRFVNASLMVDQTGG